MTTAAEVEVTGISQRTAWSAGRVPEPERIGPGTWVLPVVFPDNPLRYTLSYLLEDSGGPVLVDPGCLSAPGPGALTAVLATAGYRPADIAGVVVTHAHLDHHGLSRTVLDASGAWMGMHEDESAMLVRRRQDPAADRQDDVEWLVRAGVPDAIRSELRFDPRIINRAVDLPPATVPLADGDLLPMTDRRVRAVWTPGHTPGHLCFHDEDLDLFFAGDHVLPRISPHIGSQPHRARTPLAPYLESLAKVARYDTAEVQPGHEWRFRGLAGRVAALLDHHERRCDEIVDAVENLGAASAWQITARLSWSRGWAAITGMNRRSAMAETVAHLEYLQEQGRIDRHEPADPGGPALFQPAVRVTA